MGFGDPGSARLRSAERRGRETRAERKTDCVVFSAGRSLLFRRGLLGSGLLGLGSGQANGAVHGRSRLFALSRFGLDTREIHNREVAFQRLLESQRGDEL